jgi:histidinol-phosphate phosphatase family protein
MPRVFEGLRALRSAGFGIIVVTNQRGISSGALTAGALSQIHEHLVRQCRNHGADIDAIYYCPHGKDVACGCRKPAPGLLLRAAQEHQLDLARCWMIGDSVSDVAAGRAASCRTVMVSTGGVPAPPGVADVVAVNLESAADAIRGFENRATPS